MTHYNQYHEVGNEKLRMDRALQVGFSSSSVAVPDVPFGRVESQNAHAVKPFQSQLDKCLGRALAVILTRQNLSVSFVILT